MVPDIYKINAYNKKILMLRDSIFTYAKSVVIGPTLQLNISMVRTIISKYFNLRFASIKKYHYWYKNIDLLVKIHVIDELNKSYRNLFKLFLTMNKRY